MSGIGNIRGHCDGPFVYTVGYFLNRSQIKPLINMNRIVVVEYWDFANSILNLNL